MNVVLYLSVSHCQRVFDKSEKVNNKFTNYAHCDVTHANFNTSDNPF